MWLRVGSLALAAAVTGAPSDVKKIQHIAVSKRNSRAIENTETHQQMARLR
jgi:hypothetical protein